jgi:tetratricopeptide (TPR) repeat protein
MTSIVTKASRFRFAAAGIAVTGCLLVGRAWAQPLALEAAPLAQAYGVGVHAYFACDFQRAHDDLTQAIEAGTQDPRAWYFRGLAALQLGRLDEAEADFERGADLEASAVGEWPVARSLERVQGHHRLALERHRVRARVAAVQRRSEAVRQRYRFNEGRQSDVLRRIRPVGPSSDPLGLFTDEADPRSAVEEVAPPAQPAVVPEDGPAEQADDALRDEPELTLDEPAEALPAEEPLPAEAPGADVFGN